MIAIMSYHDPVLLFESVYGLKIKPDGIYVDVTFGGGGHSTEIIKRLCDLVRLFAFDQDSDALRNEIQVELFVLISEKFRLLSRILRFNGV